MIRPTTTEREIPAKPIRADLIARVSDICGLETDDIAKAAAEFCGQRAWNGDDDVNMPERVTIDFTAAIVASREMAPDCCHIPARMESYAKVAGTRVYEDPRVWRFDLVNLEIGRDSWLATYSVELDPQPRRMNLALENA